MLHRAASRPDPAGLGRRGSDLSSNARRSPRGISCGGVKQQLNPLGVRYFHPEGVRYFHPEGVRYFHPEQTYYRPPVTPLWPDTPAPLRA